MRQLKLFTLVLGLFVMLGSYVSVAAADDTDASQSQLSSSENAMKNQAMVKKSLKGLVGSYQRENAKRFMNLVAEDYTGDDSMLESAIRKDFSAFTNISIRYSIGNITSDDKGMMSVIINYTRNHTVVRTGKSAKSSGSAGLVFKMVDGVYKLYSMSKPALFGLSESE